MKVVQRVPVKIVLDKDTSPARRPARDSGHSRMVGPAAGHQCQSRLVAPRPLVAQVTRRGSVLRPDWLGRLRSRGSRASGWSPLARATTWPGADASLRRCARLPERGTGGWKTPASGMRTLRSSWPLCSSLPRPRVPRWPTWSDGWTRKRRPRFSWRSSLPACLRRCGRPASALDARSASALGLRDCRDGRCRVRRPSGRGVGGELRDRPGRPRRWLLWLSVLLRARKRAGAAGPGVHGRRARGLAGGVRAIRRRRVGLRPAAVGRARRGRKRRSPRGLGPSRGDRRRPRVQLLTIWQDLAEVESRLWRSLGDGCEQSPRQARVLKASWTPLPCST